jgi:DNA polymerase-1
VLGFDVETTGLDPRSHRIRLIQLAVPGGPVYVVDLFRVDARILEALFAAGPRLVGHNLKFDLSFLAAAGLPVPDGRRLFDTMLAAQLLGAGTDEGRLDHCGLQNVAERHLGVTIDKSAQTSDWTGPLTQEQLAYAAQDAAILLPLAETLGDQIREADLGRVLSLEKRALPAISWLESTGAPFDAEAWVGLSDRVVEDQVRLEQALTEMAGREDQAGAKAINWRSPEQVKRVLRERGHDVERTDEATLTGLAPDDPLARLLLQYREAVTRASRYGIAFLRNVDAGTGRIHADYFQLGAASGRMSCRGPNLQQVPRDPAYRACFRPAPGRVLVKSDYSQIELRIAAEIAGDQRMLDAYLANSDLHMVTAAAVLGRSNGTVMKADRQLAKAVNFGLLYGMGAPRLREYAIQNYGVELTPAQAEEFREKFLSTFPGLRGWHRHQGNVRPEEPDTRTLAGRRRLAVKKYTERLNTPVQGTGADGLKAALALLWESRFRVPSAAPVLCIHDEIVLEVDEGEAEQAREWLVECMKRGMRSFLLKVPVEVEAEIIADWSGTPVAPAREVSA